MFLSLCRDRYAIIRQPRALSEVSSLVLEQGQWACNLTLGFSPYSPIMCAGMRMLPPISVPQPRKLPFIKSNAASPPVEPPGVYLGFIGLVVSPQTGLSVSHHYAVRHGQEPNV